VARQRASGIAPQEMSEVSDIEQSFIGMGAQHITDPKVIYLRQVQQQQQQQQQSNLLL
jgi:hypothetical protein